MKKRIEIRRGDEFCTKVCSIYDKEDFFYEAYCKAAQGVGDIVRATGKYRREAARLARRSSMGNANQSVSGITEYMQMAGYPNNFVAFCAGRGQGKTSAMVSFSTALRELGESGKRDFWKDEILNSSFYVLDPIDPTMMSKQDSILRVIISRMFECYTEEQNDLCIRRSGYIEKEPELLNRFRQCYRNLDVLQKGRQLQDCYDDLEYLADLGDSSNMKRTFHALVTLFLELMFHNGGDGPQFLVIQIDDADLNAGNAYHIVEELRKYCVVPNVVILMASDFDQLELTVEQYFLEEFKTLYNTKPAGGEVPAHCHKMMERYLDKLIPGARQVHLPQIDNYIRNHENELVLKYWGEKQTRTGGGNTPQEPERDYQDTLLQLIYKKTRLLLIKPEGYLHNLLPKTMRELTHLLAFLDDLPEIPKEGGVLSQVIETWKGKKNLTEAGAETDKRHEAAMEALARRRDNINSLMDYLRHCWVKAALNERQQAVVIPAMEATIDLKIRQLLNRLEEYGAEKHKAWGNVKKCDAPQYTDVIETLNKLKSLLTSPEDFALIYISATVLTLYMHLLAIQDLEKGLEFEALTQFMGEGVFPLEAARFEYAGLSYDRMDITYDLVSAAAPGSGGIDLADLDTRIVAQLLLSAGGPDHQSAPALAGTPFLSSELGNRVSLLQLFKNCLTRTADRLDSPTITEALDIVLSWDLQYHISKKLRAKNKTPELTGGWPLFENWARGQLSVVDKVYQGALKSLGITTITATASLESALRRKSDYLEALAMGNPGYAACWLNAVKKSLGSVLDTVQQNLDNASKYIATGRKRAFISYGLFTMANTLLSCVWDLSRLYNIELVASAGQLLSFAPLYQEGLTLQSVINKAVNEAQELLPAFVTDDGMKGLTDEEIGAWLLEKASEIPKLLSKVKDCQRKLAAIELVYPAPAEEPGQSDNQETAAQAPKRRPPVRKQTGNPQKPAISNQNKSSARR